MAALRNLVELWPVFFIDRIDEFHSGNIQTVVSATSSLYPFREISWIVEKWKYMIPSANELLLHTVILVC